MSVPDSEVRVALIGFGLAGAVFHAPLIHAIPGLKLAGIVTTNVERIEQAGRLYPDAKVLSTTDEIWANSEEFDLVVIASPNRYHFDQAKSALESGLHVVVDKPVATTVSECRELIKLSEKQNRLLAVFQNRRWDNDFLTIQQLIADGALGTITRFESRYERYRPEPKANPWRESADSNDAGGLLFDLGSHLIDQACHLFGDPISVYAEVDVRRANVRVDDDVFVALSFQNNVKAHLWASSVARLKGPRFRVLGLKGAYEKFGIDPQELRLRSGWNPDSPDLGLEPEADWGRLSTQVGGVAVDGKVETMPGRYRDFYVQVRDAITTSGAAPVDPKDALRTMEIIEAAFRSAESGAVVMLEKAKV